MTGDETAIRALIEQRIEAMRGRDARAALATLTEDVVAFELAPPLRLGPEQARDAEALQAWFAMFEGAVDVEIADLVIRADGEVGYCHSLNRMRATRIGGAEVDFWMRSTLGLRKVGGAWRIAHGHTSVPFAMDGSYRALLDLKP